MLASGWPMALRLPEAPVIKEARNCRRSESEFPGSCIDAGDATEYTRGLFAGRTIYLT